jgi:beta-glucosidase
MDVIHGYETTFPFQGLSSTWDMKLIEQKCSNCRQASADGINWTFSPMVDVSRDPRWEEFLKVLVKMLI